MLRSFYCEHNPSITIYVEEDEWLNTAAWVYENFEDVGGLTFLPNSDHVYQLAPYEDIDQDTYIELCKQLPAIDFFKLSDYEKEDMTTGNKELACTGDACTIR
jgi:ribonucleoside-diphosphate reductase alpha chain